VSLRPDTSRFVGQQRRTPVVICFALGDRSAELLDRMKRWMARHNAVIMTVLCLVSGAKLIGDSIAGLA
jgi:hypothetical protein